MRSPGWDSEEMVQTPLGNCSISTLKRGVLERFCAGMSKFANPPTLLPTVSGSRRGQLVVMRCPVFRSPAISEGGGDAPDPGTSAPSPSGVGLIQFVSRVLGGPGDAGTG
jgi:hypothetical protein